MQPDPQPNPRRGRHIYYTYTEEKPISFNPFFTDDGVFDVEKKDSIKTLLLTLWKSEDDRISKTESGELGSALSMFLDKMKTDRNIVPLLQLLLRVHAR